ncbi:hypothetical protein RhiirC2_794140 [Rhizophagus irregularis]|uniref:Uncharacterized protein n=1 Tax=Rhizophagus irregularis TaxID=588596 RepID=A0A2N1ME28_9GLOM|nr:hypothetical protein RhiirC2_794140 [Rhizophagus irregularis]
MAAWVMSGENARVISGAEVEAAAEKQELAEFKKAFSDYPDFHVILGPPSSGKTALVYKAYDFLIHIYCLDLHNLHVTTYVIGDLSKEEAEEYFEKHILSQNEFKKAFSDYPDFHVILGPPSSGKTALVYKAYDFLIHIYCLDLHNLHVTTYVIGDLSKEEAEEYFEKHILSQNGTPSEPGIQRNEHFLDLEFSEMGAFQTWNLVKQ